MATVKNKNVLAIGAHPDDMEQFCGGTLKLISDLEGYQVTIAALTSGECGSNELSPQEIIAIRKKESEEGARKINANFINVGITDGSIEYNLETTRKIVALIREVNPLIIFTHPTEDYMTDHAHTGQLVLWAVPESTHKNFRVDTEASHLEKQPYVYHTDPQGLINKRGQIVEVNTIIDITDVVEEKLEALGAHESQIGLLQKGTAINAVEKTRRWAATRGQQIRRLYGEGFCQVLYEQYPRDNNLVKILGQEKVITL